MGVVDGEAGLVDPLAQVVAHAALAGELFEQGPILGDQAKLAIDPLEPHPAIAADQLAQVGRHVRRDRETSSTSRARRPSPRPTCRPRPRSRAKAASSGRCECARGSSPARRTARSHHGPRRAADCRPPAGSCGPPARSADWRDCTAWAPCRFGVHVTGNVVDRSTSSYPEGERSIVDGPARSRKVGYAIDDPSSSSYSIPNFLS